MPGDKKPIRNNESLRDRAKSLRDSGLEVGGDLLKIYVAFAEKIPNAVSTIYYPCCGPDANPSLAFPDSRIIYADLDDVNIKRHKSCGNEAYIVDVTGYNHHIDKDGSSVDIKTTILMNPAIKPDVFLEDMRIGEYILCNDYSGTARDLIKEDNFELVTVMRQSVDGSISFDTEQLDLFFTKVSSDEEFEGIAPEQFNEARQLLTSTEDSVVETLKGLRKETPMPRRLMLPYLPNKKGYGTHNYFVFKRSYK